ncbi:nuclear transport factor 2 family protein [Salinibius halmophilus]|uniref:nuclear transport factor 2 family protein n=1 Tax=Salinibius halmophilus TaxID=1853216 RepID=UPI000E664617|nr:nuclear transport factor 2 family protein [Salinibius halmophilus]
MTKSEFETLLEAYNRAFTGKDLSALQEMFAHDIVWHAIGQQQLIGVEAVFAGIKQSPELQSITVESRFIEMGHSAQFGFLLTKSGEKYHFADRYTLNERNQICEIQSIIAFDLIQN